MFGDVILCLICDSSIFGSSDSGLMVLVFCDYPHAVAERVVIRLLSEYLSYFVSNDYFGLEGSILNLLRDFSDLELVLRLVSGFKALDCEFFGFWHWW